MGTVMLKCFVGGIAGILVWLIFEAQAPHTYNDPSWDAFETHYVLALGAVIGAAIGGVSGWLQGGKMHMAKGIAFGGLFGAMGILVGHDVGSSLFHTISPLGLMATNIPGRIISFGIMGACLGVGIGASTMNGKRAVQGLIGGGLAGAIGGAFFDIVSKLSAPLVMQVRNDSAGGMHEVGIVGRAFLALILGALIGLFIGLVERFARSAWVRLVLGRNEGREWSIDSAVTTLGRSESATIPLFGDSAVGPVHAEIQRHGPQTYVLVDSGSPAGTFLNGQRIQSAALVPGAQIQIGGFRLEFLMKNVAAPNRGPETLRGQMSYPYQPGGPSQPYGGGPQSPAPQAPAAASGHTPGSLYSGSGAAPGPTMGQPASGSPYPAASNPTVAYSNQTVAYGATAAPQGGFALVALDGPLSGQRFPVTGSLTLGRESAQVPMGYDQQASRRHAEVSMGPGFLNVQDLGSTNGTFVNGSRVPTGQARPGDILKVGATSFRVEA